MTNHYLLHNLILFGRLLRTLGMDVNPGRMIDLVQAMAHVNLARKSDFFYTARSLLVHDREDLPLFEQAFELFWRAPRQKTIFDDLLKFRPEAPENNPIITTPPLKEPEQSTGSQEDAGDDEVQHLIEVTRTYSTRERLHRMDFGDLTQEEMQAVKRFMAQMVWRTTTRFTAQPAAQSTLRRRTHRVAQPPD